MITGVNFNSVSEKTIGKEVRINEFCLIGGELPLSDELGVDVGTRAMLVHTDVRSGATIDYIEIMNGEHKGQIIEITMSFRSKPIRSTARWLQDPLALLILRRKIRDSKKWTLWKNVRH